MHMELNAMQNNAMFPFCSNCSQCKIAKSIRFNVNMLDLLES